jgi:acid phosphatase (class A)
MMNFSQIGDIDSLVYGRPAHKHLETIEKQGSDTSTALGRYLRRGYTIILPPPPRNGSTKTLLELNHIISRMAESTQEEREYAISMDNIENHYTMWANEATKLTGKKYDMEWFWHIGMDMGDGFLNYLKVRYNRPRPYQLAPHFQKKIVPIVKEHRSAAYPSGHAFDAWVFAFLLSDIHPDHADDFEAIASRLSDSRMIAGLHYPSDLEAGKAAAYYAVENNLIEV